MDTTNLTHHFLIAMPALEDPTFAGTLVYVADHSERGALGIIINRPMELDLQTLFSQVDIPFANDQLASEPVYFGGPVQPDRGFVLHRPAGEWSASLTVQDSIGVTSSRDILQSIADSGLPQDFIIALGYCGWGAGQLENELARNDWLTVPADLRVIFDTPVEARVQAAVHLLGIDLAFLSDTAGHA